MKRIHIHWTAGTHKANSTDKRHYHFIVEGDGEIVAGDKLPEANLDTSDGDYAAHTRAANTGAIGVAVAAMHGAKERPFDAGGYPITPEQLTALAGLCADLADGYNIPVSRSTILTHAEVQPTLGIRQRNKWDITWLPGMTAPGDPIAVGDRIRDMIELEMQPVIPAPPVVVVPAPISKERSHPAQSTTIQATFIAFMAMLGQIMDGAKGLVSQITEQFGVSPEAALFLVGAGALAWVFRERLKKWAQGVR